MHAQGLRGERGETQVRRITERKINTRVRDVKDERKNVRKETSRKG